LFHLVVGEDLYRHSLLSNHIDLSIKYLKWNDVHVSSGMSVSVDISVDMTPWNPCSCSHVSVNMIHGVVHVSSGMSIIADLASLDVCTTVYHINTDMTAGTWISRCHINRYINTDRHARRHMDIISFQIFYW
jgi:hypothetical protein